jgi:hypothetical protein
MSGPFAAWVATADAVRATTKKLEKNRLLGAYLAQLDDADLVIATRLFAGAPFPRKDERVLSVGWSALSDVLLERSGKSGEDMRASYQRPSTGSRRCAGRTTSASWSAGCCDARTRARRATS